MDPLWLAAASMPVLLLLIFLPTQLDFLQRGLGLTSLDGSQWLLCIAAAIALLLVDEIVTAATASGARVIATPIDREWGGYSAYIADPEGQRWEIAWAR